jgi:hypothetical protein
LFDRSLFGLGRPLFPLGSEGNQTLALPGKIPPGTFPGSASVAFADYCTVLGTAQAVLPPDCQVTLLADRGFEHGALIRWLQNQQWAWAIRAKSDLKITLASGRSASVATLLPKVGQAALYRDVTILGDIQCHLATAHASVAQESWAVMTGTPPSLQTFDLYGQRFGGIEPQDIRYLQT